MPTLLVLSRPKPGARPPPSETPLGRALQRLAAEGIRGLVGTAAESWGVEGDRWIPADPQDAEAIHDRFPSWTYAEEHRAALRGLEDLPRANGEALQALAPRARALIVPGAGHDDVHQHEAYLRELRRSLDGL